MTQARLAAHVCRFISEGNPFATSDALGLIATCPNHNKRIYFVR